MNSPLRRIAIFLLLPMALFIIESVNDDEYTCFAQSLSIEAQLGQNFVVGIPAATLDKKSEAILRRIKPAGIVLYSRNYKSLEQLRELVNKLQLIGLEETGQPFFIMIDEEPQGATRLGLLTKVFVLGLPDWKKIERNIAVLSNIGINVDLAPLADFPYNPKAFIKQRMPVDNEEDLVQFNTTFIALLHRYGMLSTLKHFPGLGMFQDDPHNTIPLTYFPEEVFNRSLSIFQEGVSSGADFVMTGHAIYKNIDPNNPATFSSLIIQNTLKEKLKFRGLVITDDLSDMPLRTYNGLDITGAVIASIMAGHNLVLLSHNLQRTSNLFDDLLDHVKDDKELRLRISANYAKIMSFKERCFREQNPLRGASNPAAVGLFKPPATPVCMTSLNR